MAAERPERLSRERIVDVALSQMETDGYDAVSMRSIARALNTGPASLYAHVANKDELDQLVIDRISSMVPVPEPDATRWAEQARQMMRDTLAAYRRHPGSARAALATIPTGEGGLQSAEAVMALLIGGGIHPQAASWFADLSALFVSGVAAEESIWIERGRLRADRGEAYTEDDVVDHVRRLYSSLPTETYPTIVRYADQLTAGDGDDRFEFGLDVLLAGLEAVSARMAAEGPH